MSPGGGPRVGGRVGGEGAHKGGSTGGCSRSLTLCNSNTLGSRIIEVQLLQLYK